MLEELRTAHGAREAELVGQIEALKRKVFGKTSEKMPTPAEALRKKDGRKADPAATQQKRRRNQERKDQLETEVVPHHVPAEDRTCETCASGELVPDANPELRTDYDYVPGYFRRRVHEQEVLVCSCCRARRVAAAPK